MDKNRKREYVPMTFHLDTDLYHVSAYLLGKIGSSVEEFSALCILKMVRYLRVVSDPTETSMAVLISRVVDEVAEELELCYANRPKVNKE